MANFPTLYRRGTDLHNPVVGQFKDKLAHDPTVRSLSDGGYVTTRARFTRTTRKWSVNYNWLSQANKNTLRTFVEDTAVGGAESFSWVNPEDSVTYTVRFFEPESIEYTPKEKANFTFYAVNLILEEV